MADPREAEATWRSMDSAPKEPIDPSRLRQEFLASRNGKIILCWWDDDRYATKPHGYWGGTDVMYRGKRFARETAPDGWMPLPAPIAKQ